MAAGLAWATAGFWAYRAQTVAWDQALVLAMLATEPTENLKLKHQSHDGFLPTLALTP
jgi:hypothetical protein